MLKSMTGYGSHREQDAECSQIWEIKSVNAKQLSLKFRLPPLLSPWEPVWDQQVRRVAERGRVEITLNLQILRPDMLPLQLNGPALQAMLDQLERFAAERGSPFTPDCNQALRIPGLWQETSLPSESDLGSRLEAGLSKALDDWDASRTREGQALQSDLLERMERLAGGHGELLAKTSSLAEEKLERLRERMAELLAQQETQPDEQRLLQEMALLADKVDVSEELTRLRTHIDALQHYLSRGSAGGRKLDFLLQECFREINTCGNKAQNAEASRLVVDLKTELEKCREQVQNLE